MGSLIGTDLISKIAIPIQSLLASMIVGVGVTTIAAIIPAIQAGRISPITAIRIRGKSQTGWLADHGWKVGVTLLIVSTCILILNPFPYDPQFILGSMTVFLMFGGLTLVIAKLVSEWEKLLRPLMKLIYGNSGLIGSRNIERSNLEHLNGNRTYHWCCNDFERQNYDSLFLKGFTCLGKCLFRWRYLCSFQC